MPDIKLDRTQGAWTDGDIRYVMIRADGLMGAFQRGDAGLAALELSVYTHGRQSLLRYQTQSVEPRALLDTVTEVAGFLGWGVWRFEHSDPAHLTLHVQNSPFAAVSCAHGAPACAPILGMFRAIAEVILHSPIDVREHRCAVYGATACEFQAAAAPGPASQTARMR